MSVKLVAEDGVGTIAAGVVKALAEVVHISGANGGTGASPLSSIKHAGMPWELGLADTQTALIDNGLRDRVRVRVDGGFMTGRDVVMAALLGADEFSFGTAAMIAEGCIMLRACHRDTCTTGIATQRPHLRAKFAGTPEGVAAYLWFVAEEVRQHLSGLGFHSLDEAIGRVECLRQRSIGQERNERTHASIYLTHPPQHSGDQLDGSGPAYLEPPSLSEWPDVHWAPDYQRSTSVNLDTLTPEEVASWKPGQTLLLNGKMLTGRDAAHKRITDMLAKGEKLPVDFTNRVIYYVGPVDPVRDEVVGPAGPTTATRMDKFTETMLAKTGLIAMIGKAERGPVAIEAIRMHRSAYLMAVGGAAYLVSKAIKSAKVLGFADLGMEAIYEFDVKDMPVTVAVDSTGTSVHETGPREWQAKIGKIPVAVAV